MQDGRFRIDGDVGVPLKFRSDDEAESEADGCESVGDEDLVKSLLFF